MPRAHALAVQLEADVTLAEHGLVERTDDVDLEQLNVIGRVRVRQERFELPHCGVDVLKESADQAAVRRLQHRDVLERPPLGLVDAQLDHGRARWPEHRQVQPRSGRAAAGRDAAGRDAARRPHHLRDQMNEKKKTSASLCTSVYVPPVFHPRACSSGVCQNSIYKFCVVPSTRPCLIASRCVNRRRRVPFDHNEGEGRMPRPAPVMIRVAPGNSAEDLKKALLVMKTRVG